MMTAPSESKPEQPELSTQELPKIPAVQEMETWDEEKVLRWIKQRNRNILKGDNLENFNKERIMGRAFLASDVEFYQTRGLPCRIGLALKHLANEVKRAGKSIPRMKLRHQLTVSKTSYRTRQPAERGRVKNIFNTVCR
jgi:hypothetical protein